MPALWKKNIEEIKDSGYLKADISITDALIENFYNEILKPEDRKLLELFFSKNPTQQELDELLKDWDIEVKGSAKALMLAYFMKQHPELKFSSYVAPRLKGLINFFRFQNLKVMAHYTKIGKALNANGIKPMILKGGAMKYLRQELPRVMGDIDALVPEKDFMNSIDIVMDLVGYEYEKIDIHSVDFHEIGCEAGALDLHKFIYMETGNEEKFLEGLFKRSREELVFGVKSLVPCHEDLMFITLVNLARNLRNNTSKAGLLYALFDCEFLMRKPDFDWKIVIENARKTKTEVQMNFAVKFIRKISENILPEKIKDAMLFEKETQDYSNVIMFNRFYLEDLRNSCRGMKIKDVLSHPYKLGKYITQKPVYCFLKLLRGHPKLIELIVRDLKTRKYDFQPVEL